MKFINLPKGLAICLILSLFACKKEQIISGNEPPPDPTVENILLENYLNSCYLNLIGRLPEAAEFQADFAFLKKNNVAAADRQTFLNKLIALPAYRTVQFKFENLWLVQGKADDQGYIDYLRDLFTAQLADPDFAIQHDKLQRDLDRINLLDEAKEAWLAGQISYLELQNRLCDNRIFMYENNPNLSWMEVCCARFLLREATGIEKQAFNEAANTLETILWGKTARNFDEFKALFFASPEFFEGQVRLLFLRFIYREPSADELSTYTKLYQQSADFPALQRAVLASDEFLGI